MGTPPAGLITIRGVFMENFYCPDCGRVSYSSANHITECPHCRDESLLIVNPEIPSMLANARIIMDRRVSSKHVDVERRSGRPAIAVGWLVSPEA